MIDLEIKLKQKPFTSKPEKGLKFRENAYQAFLALNSSLIFSISTFLITGLKF